MDLIACHPIAANDEEPKRKSLLFQSSLGSHEDEPMAVEPILSGSVFQQSGGDKMQFLPVFSNGNVAQTADRSVI